METAQRRSSLDWYSAGVPSVETILCKLSVVVILSLERYLELDTEKIPFSGLGKPMSSCVRRRLNSIFGLVYFEVADFDPEQWMSDLDTIHKTPILLKRPHALVSQNPVSQALVLHGRNPTNTMSARFSFRIRQQK